MDLGCFSSNFTTTNNDLFNGRAKTARVFDTHLPALGTETWRALPAGIRPFWSCKAPAGSSPDKRDWAGALAGAYDSDYAALFAAFPAEGRLTVCHEPEDNMSAADFRALTERLVALFRANAQPGAQYWIVADAWQWNPANASYANYQTDAKAAEIAALVPIVDGVAADVYGSSTRTMVSFGGYPGYTRWWRLVGQPAQDAGKEVGLAERGLTAETATTRQALLIQDAADARAYKLSCYHWWASSGPAGDNTITDTSGKNQMRQWAASLS